jgi:hypothetical protein
MPDVPELMANLEQSLLEAKAAFNFRDVRSRCAAATPGPWAVPVANVYRVIAPDQPHTNVKEGLTAYPWRIVADMGDPDGLAVDATFIAHARTDLPRALDMIDALIVGIRSERQRWNDIRHWANEQKDGALSDKLDEITAAYVERNRAGR